MSKGVHFTTEMNGKKYNGNFGLRMLMNLKLKESYKVEPKGANQKFTAVLMNIAIGMSVDTILTVADILEAGLMREKSDNVTVNDIYDYLDDISEDEYETLMFAIDEKLDKHPLIRKMKKESKKSMKEENATTK